MTLLHRNTAFGACLIATATLFIAPVYANPDDYTFELAGVGPDQSVVTIRLKNTAKNQLVSDALIDFAADVGPAGFTTMTAPGIAHPYLEPGEYVRIGVKDTGCGMDEATLRRACEPFFTTKDKGRGTGLGLSMVHGFAAQSGGAMQITSRVGGGTLVELWVPVADGAVADLLEPAAAPAHAANTRSLRVLVVDDDPFVGESTAAMIEDLGHLAINVESAAGALEVMRSEPSIDIVITDYAMPGKNGAELAADIRQSRPDLPVVISDGG